MVEGKGAGSDLPVSIVAADFSPDGQSLVTASLEGTLAEWDAGTGRRRRVLLDPRGVEDDSPHVVLIKDGREVEPPFQLRRWSESVRGSSLLSVRFSPDGHYFAVGAANGQVVVWNARSRGELRGRRAHDADVVTLDISPDRRWLATGSLEEGGTTFRVWRILEDTVEIQEAFSDGRHVCGVWAVSFSPDSRIVAAGGWTLSGYTAPLLYEVPSGKPVGGFYWDMTRAMTFSPDGSHFITGDEFGSVKLWSLRKDRPLYEIKAHGGIVSQVGFSPDGQRIHSGSDGGIRIWEAEGGGLIREFPLEGRILACRHADGGRMLYAATARTGADHPEIHRLVQERS